MHYLLIISFKHHIFEMNFNRKISRVYLNVKIFRLFLIFISIFHLYKFYVFPNKINKSQKNGLYQAIFWMILSKRVPVRLRFLDHRQCMLNQLHIYLYDD